MFYLMVGAASVPTGLIVLGGSLSGLSLRHGLPPWSPPSQTSADDRGSIILMAILKLAVLPVIGVLWTQFLTYHTPLVNPENIMLRFIMILLSGGAFPLLLSTLRGSQLMYSSDGDDTGNYDSSFCTSRTW